MTHGSGATAPLVAREAAGGAAHQSVIGPPARAGVPECQQQVCEKQDQFGRRGALCGIRPTASAAGGRAGKLGRPTRFPGRHVAFFHSWPSNTASQSVAMSGPLPDVCRLTSQDRPPNDVIGGLFQFCTVMPFCPTMRVQHPARPIQEDHWVVNASASRAFALGRAAFARTVFFLGRGPSRAPRSVVKAKAVEVRSSFRLAPRFRGGGLSQFPAAFRVLREAWEVWRFEQSRLRGSVFSPRRCSLGEGGKGPQTADSPLENGASRFLAAKWGQLVKRLNDLAASCGPAPDVPLSMQRWRGSARPAQGALRFFLSWTRSSLASLLVRLASGPTRLKWSWRPECRWSSSTS